MKKLCLVAILVLCSFTRPEINSAESLLQAMYGRYHGVWHKTLRFSQITRRYRNDSLMKTDTWYEHVLYPDKLRIDFSLPMGSFGVIFRNDSTYSFRDGKIVRAVKGGNELIFFLGGMYAGSFDEIPRRFAALHYDLSKFHTNTWKGKPVYVLGAGTDDERANQLWVDREKLVPVRFIKFDGGVKQEGWFENHIPLQKAWSETSCSFYVNGKLLQTETYQQVAAGEPVDEHLFDPGSITR